MKVVISTCFGGFGLSEKAYKELGLEWDGYGFGRDLPRDDPRLVAAVEKLGEAASGRYAQLTVVELPDSVDWQVEEYDGSEWIAEKHRTWN